MAKAKQTMKKKPIITKEPIKDVVVENKEIETLPEIEAMLNDTEIEKVETAKFPIKVKALISTTYIEENVTPKVGEIFEVANQERLDKLLGKNQYNTAFVELV